LTLICYLHSLITNFNSRDDGKTIKDKVYTRVIEFVEKIMDISYIIFIISFFLIINYKSSFFATLVSPPPYSERLRQAKEENPHNYSITMRMDGKHFRYIVLLIFICL